MVTKVPKGKGELVYMSEGREQTNKIEVMKRPVHFLKKENRDGEGGREEHSGPFLGAITGGNGSHLSHLDI